MLMKKSLAWVVLAPLLMKACTASQTLAINNQISTVTESINKYELNPTNWTQLKGYLQHILQMVKVFPKPKFGKT